ncbi:MAG: outer membrane lipoprotein chaperone LolA [Betaproteobacteria bacterium]|nr:outer membrane lipoprotein chaperone LolA [Betaproteobacteria bacterium]
MGAGALVALLLGTPGAWAGGLDRLRTFVQDTKSGEAQFTQTNLSAKSGQVGSKSSGLFQFSRPGRFRWEYREPYPQLIVGDGQTLWIWDPDLKQVTRKKLSDSLGSTPAAILAGDNALEKGFRLEEDGQSDGLEWVLATPKTRDSGFERVRLGFDATSLARMELRDNFGHTILIRFTGFRMAPRFAPDAFHFTPPAGADVIQ